MSGIRLVYTDAHARLVEDEIIPGAHVLLIGDREQSHVNAADPANIFYAYLDRMRHGIEEFFPADQPLRAVHLGAGALTLARALEASRPGSSHVSVDIEPRLVPYVLSTLPFDGELEVVSADGLDWAENALQTLGPGAFDVIIVDIFTGMDSPAHLASAECYRLLLDLVGDGLLAVNLGDDPPLTFTEAQIGSLRQAAGGESGVLLGTEQEMLTRTVPGNSIALASRGGFPEDFEARWRSHGPHPAFAARGVELDAAFGF